LMFLCLEERRTYAKTVDLEPFAPYVRRYIKDYATSAVS
jgi:hypothetical protein